MDGDNSYLRRLGRRGRWTGLTEDRRERRKLINAGLWSLRRTKYDERSFPK